MNQEDDKSMKLYHFQTASMYIFYIHPNIYIKN